ncbi:MAG: putative NUDIX hydrolase [Candidatus Accumulibacter sp. BA-94]|nr:MAG: putative NUDIX hydrolase [Candidatus Accumulibacter sp. BA-94]
MSMPSPAELAVAPPSPERDSVSLDRVRQVLQPAPCKTRIVLEDGVGDEELMPAAVLFPIVRRDDEPTVLLTQRTAHLKDHPGQISFPGGRCESADPSPVHTALREAAEEIGLAAAHVDIAGYLPEYLTSTGFRVTPVVAMVTPPFELQVDAFEVAEVFEVPLSFLLDPANHQRHSLHYRGRLRHYYAMPYRGYFIWGATAGIIMSLYRALAAGGR